jgi:hypothetical protein
LLNDKVAGFDVYERRAPSGQVTHIVPELNGLIVLLQNPDGSSQTYRDIWVGEPRPDVFMPPPGVTLRHLSGPPSAKR